MDNQTSVPPKQTQQADNALKNSSTNIHIKIYSPYKVYFNDYGEGISAVNDTGPFDVLPKHHNFMSILKACELVVRTSSKEQRFKIDRGIMHVKNNRVIVFLDV
jgi:F0F1-type ATP synthase epsilon subunit